MLRPHTTLSCGGTATNWTTQSPDDFPEHAALHAEVRDLQKQLNAVKDLAMRGEPLVGHCSGCASKACNSPVYLGTVGWFTRLVLTRYLRTR